MKGLAVCISGSLRSIEYCIKNFIENEHNINHQINEPIKIPRTIRDDPR